MALFKQGDTVIKNGIYQCIYCRNTVILVKGNTFPPCPGGCERPAYTRTEKTIPPISQSPGH
jgi:hypothetical protein